MNQKNNGLSDEMGLLIAKKILSECKQQLLDSYESAGMSGLCAEGRWEVAIQSIDTLDLKSIVNSVLSTPSEACS